MDEYSDYLILMVIVIAFIAGYSIVSFLIKSAKKMFDSFELPPPMDDKNKPSNELKEDDFEK